MKRKVVRENKKSPLVSKFGLNSTNCGAGRARQGSFFDGLLEGYSFGRTTIGD
jgi:hypothetical protein